MDFLKLDQLKTVIQAIWQPKIELGLAFLLMIIVEYNFHLYIVTTFRSWATSSFMMIMKIYS